jgi:hypothetical protein
VNFPTSDEWTVESLRPRGDLSDAVFARRRRLVVRALAFAGAALFAFAAWAPWLRASEVFTYGPDASGPNGNAFDFSADSSLGLFLLLTRLLRRNATYDPYTTSRLLFFAWGGLTALGLLIAPLLWQRLAGRYRRAPLYAFSGWLGVATLATLALAYTLWTYQPETQDTTLQVAITGRQVGLGLWLTLLGLAAAWAAVALLLRERPEAETATAAPEAGAMPHGRRWAGVGLFTAGTAIWLLGFAAVPWVAVNCTSLPLTLNHFADGVCGVLDSADALSTQLVQHISPNTWNLSDGMYPIYGALLGGALLLLVAVWRRPASRMVAVWATLWLAAASLASFLAYRGVGVVIQQSPALTTDAQGVWNGTTGVAMALFGLLLGWLAILPLEGARWWSIGASVPRGPTAPMQAESGPFAASGDDFEVTRTRMRD